jgi:RNA polymerase sigma-70 factor (ECF subfamily)
MNLNDTALVRSFIDGDRGNFDLLLKKYLNPVYNFVFKMAGDKNLAEDIVQETFVKVWKNIKKFDQNQNFKTWIFAIARNTTIDWLRKRQEINFSAFDVEKSEEEDFFADSIADSEALQDELLYKKEVADKLGKIMLQVEPHLREIIILHHTEEMTFDAKQA